MVFQFNGNHLGLSDTVALQVPASDASGACGSGSYDILGPTGETLGYPTIAATAGDSVEFGVGFGRTNPSVPAGQPFSGVAATVEPVTLYINGVSIIPMFAGISSAGLYQLNITIPAGLPTGDVFLQLTVSDSQTPFRDCDLASIEPALDQPSRFCGHSFNRRNFSRRTDFAWKPPNDGRESRARALKSRFALIILDVTVRVGWFS